MTRALLQRAPPVRLSGLLTRDAALPSSPHNITDLNMPIHVYAEHLLNIRTLTIQVSLPTNSDATTLLFSDGDTFKISHQGEAVKVTLPVPVPASESVKLSSPPSPTNNLSFRVRLGDIGLLQDSYSSETVIPWTSSTLTQQIELQCQGCHTELTPRGTIQTWKDLPSEGWAEMMEFWHCHKPNEPHDHEHQTDKKGYSANSMLATTSSVGLVNATSFVLAADDCKNIKVGLMSSSLPCLNIVQHTWALKRTGAFRPQGYQKMEDSGYCCPRAKTIAAQNQPQPSRKLWVLWGSSALTITSCDLIGTSLSSLAWQISAHRYIHYCVVSIQSKFSLMSLHSISNTC